MTIDAEHNAQNEQNEHIEQIEQNEQIEAEHLDGLGTASRAGACTR